ncbi:MAG: ribonuclease E/G, partial [Gammaproteobacteria bacterium]
MSSEILVNAMPYETRVAIVEHGLAQEVHIERERRRGLVGNIYKGRVERLMPGMQAAFIDIGAERTAFLHAGDITQLPYAEPGTNGRQLVNIQALLAEGETVLVQVLKDPLGSKGARVSMHLSLPARHMVFVPEGEGVGISSRIGDAAERKRLTEQVEALRPEPLEGGYIVRTAGEGADGEALGADMQYLSQLWATLQETARAAPPATLIHEDLPLPLRVMRDLLDGNVSQIRVDSEAWCERMRRFAEILFPDLVERIVTYSGEHPIFDLYGVEDEILRALERRVDLKSGGYLIFDQTEAMATIDVNTGAYTGSHNLDDTALKINL